MAYVAATGGQKAIEHSLELLSLIRSRGLAPEIKQMTDTFSLLIDQIMSEASLYAPEYAALALRQAAGSPEEAVFILRAYRSTLQRDYYSLPVDTSEMTLLRRISSSYKDIPGGQVLGGTFDYSHRLLDFGLADPGVDDQLAVTSDLERDFEGMVLDPLSSTDLTAGRVADQLRKEGLLPERDLDPTEPDDVTRMKLQFPCLRSAKLQTLTRLDTGFLSGVAYSAMRGYGGAHPTIAELRSGHVQVEIAYPLDESQSITIGEIVVTEVEALTGSLDKDRSTMAAMDSGYGLVMGRGETKAIAMAIVDASLSKPGDAPAQDAEFVLTHGDSLEMNGFIAHLKLPHYVTFQSKLDRSRKTLQEGAQ